MAIPFFPWPLSKRIPESVPNNPTVIVGWYEAGRKLIPVAVGDDGSLAVTVTPVTTQRIPTVTTVSADVTIAAGSRGLTLIFSNDFDGTVLGAAFLGSVDSSLTIPCPDGDTLGAVVITRSAGSVRVLKVV